VWSVVNGFSAVATIDETLDMLAAMSGAAAGVEARRLRVRGVVQGVGFRPFVYRLAHEHGIGGWVVNDGEGVEIHVEGEPAALDLLLVALESGPPPASRIAELNVAAADVEGHATFVIRESGRSGAPTVRISPDLPICARCASELADPGDRRHGYPYINCTDCGPRYSIVLSLPYDRPRTTMRDWRLCPECASEYEDPLDRRFHAQPVACPRCGPHYGLETSGGVEAPRDDAAAIAAAAGRLRAGEVVAIKGIGGYHLACDARNAAAVAALRERKFRKERPFALMARDLGVARQVVELGEAAETLLLSNARPVVLTPARVELPGVAPDNRDVGVMLPYAPIHLLLFAEGAPELMVLTSANRASEPIAYRDDEARERLAGLADAMLVGERPIARRVDDSVCRVGPLGPIVLRRARGLAPSAVATLPAARPILAVGPDLKNSVTLTVGGEAFVSQHLGDLESFDSFLAFASTIEDLLAMYDVRRDELTVAHDAHPQYRSTAHAMELPAARRIAVQHHRAHVASVLAEHDALDARVVGVAFDGTGYGDDGAIWGGELFLGSVREGLVRAAHLRPASLPGGDAAARHPVQAAAGFLAALDLPAVDFSAPPFAFPDRYTQARELVARDVRVFPTTSAGRLFDTVAALAGFTRSMTFEGQAAIWVEHQARMARPDVGAYPFPFDGRELDWRPTLAAAVEDRLAGREPAAIAAAFHRAVADGIAAAAVALAEREALHTVVLSGGVFQNALLLDLVVRRLAGAGLAVWANREVPPNDGGVSLGQAAIAACA
jgi:hydrogenase maturation protein HypF